MKYWMGVVSKEHVMKGVEGRFCQVCHGKPAPLKKMKKGDLLVYYSPKKSLNGNEKYQAVTAIGEIADDKVYQFQMTDTFIPFRRNVDYIKIKRECGIDILRENMYWKEYIALLRYGHFEISEEFFTYTKSHLNNG